VKNLDMNETSNRLAHRLCLRRAIFSKHFQALAWIGAACVLGLEDYVLSDFVVWLLFLILLSLLRHSSLSACTTSLVSRYTHSGR